MLSAVLLVLYTSRPLSPLESQALHHRLSTSEAEPLFGAEYVNLSAGSIHTLLPASTHTHTHTLLQNESINNCLFIGSLRRRHQQDNMLTFISPGDLIRAGFHRRITTKGQKGKGGQVMAFKETSHTAQAASHQEGNSLSYSHPW